MSNLICCKPIDFNLLRSLDSVRRFHVDNPRVPEQPEPIHVRVRIRQHSDSPCDLEPSGQLDLGRLPVGTLLDCYV